MSVRSGRRGAASRGGPGGGAEAWVPFRLCRTADVIRLATNTLQTLELIRILPSPWAIESAKPAIPAQPLWARCADSAIFGSMVNQNSWSADLMTGSLPVGQTPYGLASRCAGIALLTREPALRHGECTDQIMRLEGTTAAPDADLHGHPGFHQSVHRGARGLERSTDELRRRGCRDHGSGGQSVDRKTGRRVPADTPYPASRAAARAPASLGRTRRTSKL